MNKTRAHVRWGLRLMGIALWWPVLTATGSPDAGSTNRPPDLGAATTTAGTATPRNPEPPGENLLRKAAKKCAQARLDVDFANAAASGGFLIPQEPCPANSIEVTGKYLEKSNIMSMCIEEITAKPGFEKTEKDVLEDFLRSAIVDAVDARFKRNCPRKPEQAQRSLSGAGCSVTAFHSHRAWPQTRGATDDQP